MTIVTDERTAEEWRGIEHREVESFASHLYSIGFDHGVLTGTRAAVEADYAPQAIAMALLSFFERDRRDYTHNQTLAAVRKQQTRIFGKTRTG